MSDITLFDRFRGAMLGVLAGDALGAPYENMKRAKIVADFEQRGGLVAFDYLDPWRKMRQIKAGQPTDDSELTAYFGLSLAHCTDFDPSDVYSQLRWFIHGRRSILTEGEAYGSGGTLRSALKSVTYAESLVAFAQNEIPVIPSNGSLMRVSPVALRFHGNLDRIVDIAQRQSSITHVHPMAQATCVAYSVLMSELLSGQKPRIAWRKTCDVLWDHQYAYENAMLRQVLSLPVNKPNEEEIWPHTGGACISFRVALWALLSATSFRHGLTRTISLGGDVDTYGAIVGGLLGATYGIEGIPVLWRDVLIGRELMEYLGGQLYWRHIADTNT